MILAPDTADMAHRTVANDAGNAPGEHQIAGVVQTSARDERLDFLHCRRKVARDWESPRHRDAVLDELLRELSKLRRDVADFDEIEALQIALQLLAYGFKIEGGLPSPVGPIVTHPAFELP